MNQLSLLDETGQFYKFSGATYSHVHDYKRLTGQLERIYNHIKDGKWRTLQEIADACNAPAASVSAQLRNLRKKEFGSHIIDKQARGDRDNGLYEYRMVA